MAKEQKTSPDDSLARARAEDLAYTLNHSVYCGFTDLFKAPLNALTDNKLSFLIPGCGHDHSGDGDHGSNTGHHGNHNHAHNANHDGHAGHDHSQCNHHDHKGHNHGHEHGNEHGHGHKNHHDHAPQKNRWQRFTHELKRAVSRERLGQYVKGEFIADFSAVPLTIATQRLFPRAMEWLSNALAPVTRPIFSIGANRHSRKWAEAQGVSTDSPEYAAHRDALVNYEVKHFPQAIAWTCYSVGINTTYQMMADKRPMPFWSKLSLKLGTLASASAITAVTVVAARALSPKTMHSLDSWVSGTIVLPTSKTIGRVFGIDPDTVERAAKKEDLLREGKWVERTRTAPEAEQTQGAQRS